MKYSVLIPAHNEEAYIGPCLQSIEDAAEKITADVEIIVALNRCSDRTAAIAADHQAVSVIENSKNLARIRNAAARAATGEIIVTIDADSRMSRNMLVEIAANLAAGKYIGGGVMIRPERWSPGIFMSVLTILPFLLVHRISGGLFWCYRKDFEAVGGFNEALVSAEDLDFAIRLKAYGKQNGRRFKTITRAHIITSCRKFDTFGDWYLLKNPALVRNLMKGNNQKAADLFYYDTDR
ncbi:MAG: glycosyltransferase [Deltaproteobacteria bacterium]|jgi:glycosyltransferase involved in cell wall biosynthesis|nr:glycosyltransferase [Deltaproteobacteria bacterium]MBW2478388.1 glycosyltransferase [Deltaproteobacteria bacterium]